MFRFGIIGAGSIANKFCEAVRLLEGIQVAAVASKDRERARIFAENNGIAAYYDSYEEMLARQDIDAVYIATTINFHYENMMLCLKYNKPILCEKCFTLTKTEAETVFEAAKEKKLFVMEAMWSRFFPAMNKAKEWIEEGRIGTVKMVNYSTGIRADSDHRIFNPDLAGGVLYDISVYAIEICSYLINQPLKQVEAKFYYAGTGVDSSDYIMLEFSEAIAILQCTALAKVPTSAFFYGTKGYISLPIAEHAAACYLYDDHREIERFEYPFENGFQFEILETVNCIRNGKTESLIMPHVATIQCMEVFEECLKRQDVK